MTAGRMAGAGELPYSRADRTDKARTTEQSIWEDRMSISTLLKRAIAPAACALAVCALALGGPGTRAADPYKIHVILPLTGGAAFLGKGEQQALQLFEKLVNQESGINGQPIEFVYHDDQTSPQTTVQIANGI